MAHVSTLDSHILDLLPSSLDKVKILDVACGFGGWGFQIRLKKEGTPVIVGLDVWKPYLKRVWNTRIYDHLICADARKMPFRNRLFDFALACEVIEHLKQEDGIEVLKEIDRVSRDRIILSTPLGFLKQESSHNNPYEKHVSAWHPRDLKKMQYNYKIIDDLHLPRRLELFLEKIRNMFPFLNLKEIIAWKDVKKKQRRTR